MPSTIAIMAQMHSKSFLHLSESNEPKDHKFTFYCIFNGTKNNEIDEMFYFSICKKKKQKAKKRLFSFCWLSKFGHCLPN